MASGQASAAAPTASGRLRILDDPNWVLRMRPLNFALTVPPQNFTVKLHPLNWALTVPPQNWSITC